MKVEEGGVCSGGAGGAGEGLQPLSDQRDRALPSSFTPAKSSNSCRRTGRVWFALASYSQARVQARTLPCTLEPGRTDGRLLSPVCAAELAGISGDLAREGGRFAHGVASLFHCFPPRE